MAPSPAAARSDAVRDSRNYGGELRDFLRKHKEEFATLVAASADVRSRRYLLGAAAISIILGLAGLAASFTFQSSAPSEGETARVTEPETPKLEQEETQTEAAPQDGSAAEAQQSSRLMDKVKDTSEVPRPSESGPAASEDSGSATEEHNLPIASPRVQDPRAQPAVESFSAPALPTGAFSAQEPPQAPAVEPKKDTPGGPGKITHARDETLVEPLTGSPQSPPKTATRRAVSASAERPRPKAAEGKQKGGAPPQETLRSTGGAESNPPSEDIVQRALNSLFNGGERAP